MTALRERSAANSAPTLPRTDQPWTEGIIRWTRYECATLHSYPKGNGGPIVAQVYKGDMIDLSAQYQHHDWILCRSGHILGWLNVNDVKFLIQRNDPPPPKKRALVQRLIGFFKK